VLALDSIHDENCFGDSNGDVFISHSGGTPPFGYLWSNSSTNQDLEDVIAGTFSVIITDDNGCFDTLTATINEPAVLSSTTSSVNSTCGYANGTATVNPSGGTQPYSYLWSDAQTTQTATGLLAGNYSVTVTDSNSCVTNNPVIVSDTPGPALVLDSVIHEKCFGENIGGIFVSVSGGTSPINFAWSNSSTTEDLQNIAAGNYSLTVTDLNGCFQTLSQQVMQPDSIQITFSPVDETCGNANGSVSANITGGINPFTLLWSNSATTSSINSLTGGMYTLTVADSNSCVMTDSILINNSPEVTIVVDSVIYENCFGDSNGGIFISLTNGTFPFSYNWSDASTNADLSNVIAGTYSVTVTDNNGCTGAKTDNILQPAALTTTTSSVNSTCGNPNGTATATPAGGTSPYSFLWSDGQTTQTAIGLSATTYTVTVTDSHGCTFITSETVSNTAGPVLALDSIHDENCFGDSNGDIFVSPSGGTSPFTYLWSNSATDEDLQNVIAGTYSVIITDNNSCTDTLSATINEPSAVSATTSSVNSTCGNANGTATVNPSGGNSPYTFLWSDGQTAQTATGLSAVTYTVTVTDSHGCTFVTSETVSDTPGPVLALDSIHDENCFGDANGDIFISFTGGTGTMDYLWSNGATTEDLQDVAVGAYTVMITDDNNCTATLSGIITQPSQVGTTTSSVNSTCGNPNGTATANPTGGTGPYTYLWSNGQTTQTATGLMAVTHTVTVTDSHGCSFTTSETVSNTPGPIVLLDSIHSENCFGDSNGDIFISLSDGTPPFNFVWSNSSTSEDLQNVSFGNYTVTVTDNNNCTATLSAFISQPQLLTASTSSTNSTCGNANGTATVTPSGGTNPYSYLWSDAQTIQTAINLLAGNYSVTSGPSLTLDSVKNENCFGQSIGGIFITITGGTPPITYVWSNGSTAQDLQNVPAGNYSVTVTDNNNCTVTHSDVITEPTLLTATSSSTNSTCSGPNGSATVTPAGGTYKQLKQQPAFLQELIR
jgi:hypothetical protein